MHTMHIAQFKAALPPSCSIPWTLFDYLGKSSRLLAEEALEVVAFSYIWLPFLRGKDGIRLPNGANCSSAFRSAVEK